MLLKTDKYGETLVDAALFRSIRALAHGEHALVYTNALSMSH